MLTLPRCHSRRCCCPASTQKWASFLQVMLVLLLVATISMNVQVLSLALMLDITVATSNNEGVLAKLSVTRLP